MSYKIHYFLSISIVFLFLITITVQAGGGGGGGGTPPPPPPPCGYQTPGCYAQDGNKLENPTTPENFGYYLAESACIGGDCTCSLSGFVDAIKQTNPDNSGGACACISGTSWTDNIGCCGDDSTDCGLIAEEKHFDVVTERYLCSMDQNFVGSWLPAEPNKGLINYVACSNKELLSDGNSWIECSSFGITRVDDRDYLCTGDPYNSWVECCGSGSCKSDSSRAGDTATTGQSGILGNTTYYCASDKTIVTDLDIKDQETCNNAKNPNGTNAGFRWTGTLCCSENDDPGEYYNDPGGIGGCWNKEAVLTGDTVPQREDIVNIDGIFYGCNINNILSAAITSSLVATANTPTAIYGTATGIPYVKFTYTTSGGGGGGSGSTIVPVTTTTSSTGMWVVTYPSGFGAGSYGIALAPCTSTSSSSCTSFASPVTGTLLVSASTSSGSCGAYTGYIPSSSSCFYGVNYNTGVSQPINTIKNATLLQGPASCPSSIPCICQGSTISPSTAGWACSLNMPAPILYSVFPSTVTAGQAVTFVINGANFQQGAAIVYSAPISGAIVNGTTVPSFFSSSQLILVSGDLSPTTFTFFVRNPNGRASNSLSILVSASTISQSLLDITDYHTQQPLIQNKQHCYQDPSKFYFCSFNNTWGLSGGQDRSHLSTVPGSFQNVQQPAECCSATSCWDGSLCIGNQADDPTSQPINNYRCINGNWQPAQLKLTPDGQGSGYCPEQSQCLVDPSPNANPRCIQNTEFIDNNDNYCENGNWTSRTKFVALQLIDISKTGNFVVFCDTPENTLNNLNYLVQGQLAGNFVTAGNTNNFCTSIFNGKILIGTSLNKPVADVTPFLNIIGVSNCNAALINDGQYHACSGSNKVWYNQKLNSIIYSNQSFTIGTTNFLGTFINFIKNPFDAIKNRIRATIQEPFDTSYLNSLKKFSKLYISKSGTKEIRASVEGRGFNNLIMEYKNFNTDICRFIDEFNEKNEDAGSGIECSKDGSTYYVLAQGAQFTKIDPDAIWNDLTSKLRVS